MKKILSFVLMITIICSFAGCGKKEEELNRYEASFLELFNTVTTIVGYSKSKEDFTVFAQEVYDLLEEYHELYDIYNNYEGISNIKTINDNAGIAPVTVDQKVIDLLLFAKDAYKISNGELNIAFGAVLEVWHNYREEGINDPTEAKVPPMDILEERAKHTDINKLIIDEEKSTVYLEDKEMRLDVGAVAKGYATERVAREMKEKGYSNAMLSVGGNVRAIDTKPNGELWKVGIQNPDSDSEQRNLYVLDIDDYSLITSGDYQRYYVADGVKYHHIIDVDTLMPADYFTAVSIILPDSGMGDILSTAIFNIPFEEGLEMIEAMDGTEALWIFKDGTMKYSSGFEAMISK